MAIEEPLSLKLKLIVKLCLAIWKWGAKSSGEKDKQKKFSAVRTRNQTPLRRPRFKSPLSQILEEEVGEEFSGGITDCEQLVYTVGRYPGPTNPILTPSGSFEELNELSPVEFVNRLKGMPPNEKLAFMAHEGQRRRTFQAGWPHQHLKGLCGDTMAAAGLFYLGNDDDVQCAFCVGIHSDWSPGVKPQVEHRRCFPDCPFITSGASRCGNVEHKSDQVQSECLNNITIFGSNTHDPPTNSDLNINTDRPACGDNAPRASRLKTFNKWKNCPLSKTKLCDAGFYYTGDRDEVKCYYCGGGIAKWRKEDLPWDEHEKHFPDCLLVVSRRQLRDRLARIIKKVVKMISVVRQFKYPIDNPESQSPLIVV